MRLLLLWLGLVGMVVFGFAPPAAAGGKATMARELAEYAIRKFGGKAAAEGTEAVARRIAKAAARHGDSAVAAAVKRVGPRALSLVDDAGEHGAKALRLLGKHGDDAAWVLARPKALRLVAEQGDSVAAVLIRHKAVAEPILEKLGKSGASALHAVSPQNGRRIAMMLDGGDLAKIGRTEELMRVIARHGDSAADFVWRNKKSLMLGGTLIAFISRPEPFLQSTEKLVSTVAEHGLRPAAEATGQVAGHAISLLARTLTLLAVGGIGLAFLPSFRPLLKALLKLVSRRWLRQASP